MTLASHYCGATCQLSSPRSSRSQAGRAGHQGAAGPRRNLERLLCLRLGCIGGFAVSADFGGPLPFSPTPILSGAGILTLPVLPGSRAKLASWTRRLSSRSPGSPFSKFEFASIVPISQRSTSTTCQKSVDSPAHLNLSLMFAVLYASSLSPNISSHSICNFKCDYTAQSPPVKLQRDAILVKLIGSSALLHLPINQQQALTPTDKSPQSQKF